MILKEIDITTFLSLYVPGLKGLQLKNALIIGFFCAMRNGELYQFKRGNITEDREHNRFVVCIERSKTDQAGNGFHATIPYSIGVISIAFLVRDYLSAFDQFCMKNNLDPVQQPYFMTISPGNVFIRCRVGVNTLAKYPSLIARYLNLENADAYTGHCFRGSAATNMAENGASDQQMKCLCRWKSEKMADVYTRQTDRLKNEATNALLRRTNIGNMQCAPTTELQYGSNQGFRWYLL